MVMSRSATLVALVLTTWLLGACADVGLIDSHTQRSIEEAQRESDEWKKAGVPDRASEANQRAQQLQQRVDRKEIGFSEFLSSLLIDAWLGDGRGTPQKR
jgi:hypothetical protein